jgi:aarF domain-containing kinase
MFCQLAMPQHVPAFDEIEKQFLTEFDYTKEAENLERARDNVLKTQLDIRAAVSPPGPTTFVDRVVDILAVLTKTNNTDVNVVVPQPFRELCSKHMLVMEYLDGVKLVDGIRAQFRKLAPLMGKTLEEMEAETKKLMESGKFNFKNVDEEKKEQKKTRVLLALSDVYSTNALRFVYNCSPLRWTHGPWEYKWTDVPVDLAPILEKLSLVQVPHFF